MTGKLRRPVGGLAVAAALAVLAGPAVAQITMFRHPDVYDPTGITLGPDNALWFTQERANRIGRITTAGGFGEPCPPNVRPCDIPVSKGDPLGITLGPDDNLWFALASNIGQISIFEQFAVFGITANARATDITVGPDGNLWFTETAISANKIGRITTTGAIDEFSGFTAGSEPTGITAGADGNLWFTESAASKIGRITTAGVVTGEFLTRTAGAEPTGITAGPDGNLWFTETAVNKIGRITTTGGVDEFLIPTSRSGPFAITAGPDGNLWFTQRSAGKIGRFNLAILAVDKVLDIPGGGLPWDITPGPDGNIWFTERETHRIGRVDLARVSDCFGDCYPDGEITPAELITMVAIDLGTEDLDACKLGAGDDDRITVDEVLTALNDAADQCGTNDTALVCRDEGGTFSVRMCCTSASDFPDLCQTGACGCAPNSSAPTWVCDCGDGRCFNGQHCRSQPS